MIYIDGNTEYIYIPKTAIGSPIRLSITNQIDNITNTFSVTDLGCSNSVYRILYSESMKAKIGSYADGSQFDYRLESSSEVLMSGILQYGIGTINKQKYEVEKTITQYNYE